MLPETFGPKMPPDDSFKPKPIRGGLIPSDARTIHQTEAASGLGLIGHQENHRDINQGESMVRCLLIFALALLTLPTVAQARDERNDRDIYFVSVVGPVIVDVCASVLPEPNSLSTAFADWSTRNKDRVDHGRTLALTKKGESELQSSETATVAKFRKELLAASRKRKLCQTYQTFFAFRT
jgi:hypothetical protein